MRIRPGRRDHAICHAAHRHRGGAQSRRFPHLG
jgi:hypothetical protein